ncbi:MAG: RNA methyltransferase [Bacteroidales bacterium]|nr:RNA methyltransferase [Bacteroidales bacterium]
MNQKLTVEEMHRIDVAAFKAADKLPLVMVLDNVRSLHNVGSVLRTADAFRLEGVYLCGITGAPDGRPAVDPASGRPNPNIAEIHKTALGAEDSVDWHYVPTTMEAVAHLRAEGYTIVAIEQCQGSVMLNEWRAWEPPTSSLFPPTSSLKKYAFIMGNEVKGVAQDVVDAADMVIEIPQYGTKHSLNVSVTAGIVMWEVLRQALAAGILQ